MSKKKFLIQTIEAFEKPEFDKIVKVYLKEVYNYSRIVFTDGKDDIGIDIKIFDLANTKVQYQLTTQKSNTLQEKRDFESKMYADFGKAKENYDKYNYSNSLFYFYSKALTNKKIRTYEKTALQDFGITLTLIDANRIAEESEDYLALQKAILDTNDWSNINTIFPDEDQNLLFDLVSFGRPADFKLQIIEAFILQLIYEKKALSFDEIVKHAEDKFKGKDNKIFYDKLFARLQTARKITKATDKKSFILVAEEEKRIKSLKELYELEEKEFLAGIRDRLTFFDQQSLLKEYVLELKKIYVDNFDADLISVISDANTADLSKVSRDFLNFVESNLEKKYSAKELAISLFNFCKENMFLQKFAASKVYTEKINLSRIERYINTQKRVFSDTQIGLHALCYFYEPNANFQNYFFQTSKSLLSFCKKNNIGIFIFERYVWEIQNHLGEALNLIPFTNLPNFQKLGKSRNVFYNFYLYIKQFLDTELRYMDFFEKFGFGNDQRKNAELIKDYLKNVGLIYHHLEKKYDIDSTIDLIEYQLKESKKLKTSFGINNDAIMLEFLADNDIVVHPLQPLFLTWDKSFFEIQRKFFLKHPTSQRWFLMTPGKFIDQYSLLQFSIDSEIMSDEILSLLSDQIIQNAHTLLDSIVTILNPNDEIGLEYTNKLANIRDNEIHRIEENEIIPPDEVEGEAVIDDVFYKLTDYYKVEDKLDSFRKLFTQKDYVETVIQIIEKSVQEVYTNRRFTENIYNYFDALIEKMRIQIKQ